MFEFVQRILCTTVHGWLHEGYFPQKKMVNSDFALTIASESETESMFCY